MQAVITGDIVNSTKLTKAKEKKLLASIGKIFETYTMEFYRGDSFQAYLKSCGEALTLSLLCRTAAISIANNENDVRISIGLGKVNAPIKALKTAKGEAFVLSGRAFDELGGTDERLVFSVADLLANEGLGVVADHINAIFKSMTSKQAEVIFELLQGQTQQGVALKLKKTKSTINQHVTAGRWPEIERLLQRYKNIVNQLA